MAISDSRYPVATPTQLATWLQQQGVDTTDWGQGNAKTVADLWLELQHGECTLQTEPLVRSVRVVEVRIERGNTYLIETEQHFADGRIRERRRPPSEKIQLNETPLAAATRCLQEELALTANAITIPPQQVAVRTTRDSSDSYPHLTSEYTFYTVYAQVTGLPTSGFTTPNAAHADGDPIVAHRWEWVAR